MSNKRKLLTQSISHCEDAMDSLYSAERRLDQAVVKFDGLGEIYSKISKLMEIIEEDLGGGYGARN